MRELNLKARAKINLGLDVIGKRPDGYHTLRMIMQTVDVYDRIMLTRTKAPGIRMAVNVSGLPAGEGNLAYRAAKLLMDAFPREEGVYIDLYKTIPVAAGLAGGSSDAAAVLVGMNRLLHLGLSKQDLMTMGLSLGADVPYCILRGTALAEGVGEELTRLEAPPACKVLLAKPSAHVSTKYVYSKLKLDEIRVHPDIDGQVLALKEARLEGLCERMGNVLEQVTIPAFPVIQTLKETMLSYGALGSLMSGSGPTVFGLFREEKDAQKAADAIRSRSLAEHVFVTGFFPGSAKKPI